MPSQTELNQQWVELLNAHGVTIGYPEMNVNANYGRWGMGFYNNDLTDAEAENCLMLLLEGMKERAVLEGFDIEDVLAQELEFNDASSDLGSACFYVPKQSCCNAGA